MRRTNALPTKTCARSCGRENEENQIGELQSGVVCACFLPANRWSRCRRHRTCGTPIGVSRSAFQPTSHQSRTKIPISERRQEIAGGKKKKSTSLVHSIIPVRSSINSREARLINNHDGKGVTLMAQAATAALRWQLTADIKKMGRKTGVTAKGGRIDRENDDDDLWRRGSKSSHLQPVSRSVTDSDSW